MHAVRIGDEVHWGCILCRWGMRCVEGHSVEVGDEVCWGSFCGGGG